MVKLGMPIMSLMMPCTCALSMGPVREHLSSRVCISLLSSRLHSLNLDFGSGSGSRTSLNLNLMALSVRFRFGEGENQNQTARTVLFGSGSGSEIFPNRTEPNRGNPSIVRSHGCNSNTLRVPGRGATTHPVHNNRSCQYEGTLQSETRQASQRMRSIR